MYKSNDKKYLLRLKNYQFYVKFKKIIFNLVPRIGKTRNLFILFVLFIVALSIYVLKPFCDFYNTLFLISFLLIVLYFIDVLLYIIIRALIFIKKCFF